MGPRPLFYALLAAATPLNMYFIGHIGVLLASYGTEYFVPVTLSVVLFYAVILGPTVLAFELFWRYVLRWLFRHGTDRTSMFLATALYTMFYMVPIEMVVLPALVAGELSIKAATFVGTIISLSTAILLARTAMEAEQLKKREKQAHLLGPQV